MSERLTSNGQARPPGAFPRGLLLSRIARLLKLPDKPPALPAEEAGHVEQFLPHRGYPRHLVACRWVLLGPIGLSMTLIGCILLIGSGDPEGVVPALAGVAVLSIALALHVGAIIRYRLTWYALGLRSVRIRHGLFTIRETTITYENVQNVRIRQGPLQRFFGISTLEIDTAGGSSKKQPAAKHSGFQAFLGILTVALSFVPGGAAFGALGGVGQHHSGSPPGRMEGLGDPQRVRETIMRRVRQSRAAGLGDELRGGTPQRLITANHVAAMRGIRDALRELR